MPRILISAFSCGPNHGSEPGVGWNTVLELAKEPTNELWVIVEPSWEEKINAYLARHPLPNVHFLFLGNRSLSKLMCTTLTQSVSWNSYYYMWQFVHVPEMRRLHEQVRFDLAQHVTYVKLSVPSMLGFLGLPFIWGPVGGAETAPACFFTETGWKNRLYEFLRGTMLALTVWNPFVRLTARRSTLAYGVTRESADALRACGATNVLTRPAVALSDEELAALTVRTTPSDLTRAPRLLYVGNLIPLKGVHLALRALAASGCTEITLRIIGDGASRGWLEQIARENGLSARVEFLGKQPREEVLRAYADSDGFLFASLHDSGGYAVLEAMAAGLPVICLDFGGPGFLVDDTCGWKVTAQTPEEAISGLAEAIRAFAKDPAQREKRARAARARVLENFTWKQQGQVLRDAVKLVHRTCAPVSK